MTPAAAEPLPLVTLALCALLTVAVFVAALAALTIVLRRLGRLASSCDEGRQPINMIVVVLLCRLMALRLFVALPVEICLAGNERLRIAGAELRLFAATATFLRRILIVTFVIERPIARVIAGDVFLTMLILLRLILALLFLRGCNQAEIMFGVLIVVFGADRIAGSLRVACKLDIFFGDMRRRATDFDVGAVRLKDAREWIVTFAVIVVVMIVVATAHTLVLILNISPGLQFIHP